VELLAIALKKRGLVKANEMVNILVSLVWFLTTAIVTYYGIEVVMYQMDMNVLTPAMRAPVWIAYLSIPVCSGVVGIRLIVNMIQSLMVIFGKPNSESEVAK
jgi:TRAP-type C4-dicarboxylate transport system permease small subunit